MLPVIALVGRPNVGKSTLFNCLTGTRDALVADVPGLTRDRKYGYGAARRRIPYLVIDTGGLVETARGVEVADGASRRCGPIEEADRVLLVVDAREGLTPSDHCTSRRRCASAASRCFVVANKAEGLDAATSPPPSSISSASASRIAISSAHGDGVEALMERALDGLRRTRQDADCRGAGRHPRRGRSAGRTSASRR